MTMSGRMIRHTLVDADLDAVQLGGCAGSRRYTGQRRLMTSQHFPVPAMCLIFRLEYNGARAQIKARVTEEPPYVRSSNRPNPVSRSADLS